VYSFRDALAAGPIVLDGGLGTLLEEHGHDLSSSLWSARLLVDDPEAIRRAHAEYFAAGACVAVTSSYQVSHTGLEAAGLTRREVDVLLARSVALAEAARADAALSPDEAWVAASVGPYGASLADGSEYTGDYDLGTSQLRDWHRPRLQTLAAAGPDVIAVETIPSLSELEAVCLELDGLGIPAWVSVTIADGRLRSGESLADAFALAQAVPEVVAVGVNCCAATHVTAALAGRDAATPGVAYPNSGEKWDAGERRWSGDAAAVPALAGEWIDAGARLVGGCCRVGPDQIAGIARAVAARRDAAGPKVDRPA
jgi:homocysteine S-methyltransferase